MENIIKREGGIQTQAITEEMYQRYIAYLDATPQTIATYTKATRQFFKYLGRHNITQPTRGTIISYRDELKEKYTPATVQLYIIAIRQFFKWTEIEGLYPNVAKDVKGGKVSKLHKKGYLTADQAKAIINSIETDTPQGRRDKAIFVLMITCGLRDIEVSRANIGDLQTQGADTVLFVQGKGAEERATFVKIPPETEKILRASLKDREDTTDTSPLFVSLSNNSKGKRISTRSVSGTVKQTMKQAGYDSDKLTAHSLRHTAVTLSLLAGESLEATQQFARHTNINTTLIYAHHLEAQANSCSNAVANAIF